MSFLQDFVKESQKSLDGLLGWHARQEAEIRAENARMRERIRGIRALTQVEMYADVEKCPYLFANGGSLDKHT